MRSLSETRSGDVPSPCAAAAAAETPPAFWEPGRPPSLGDNFQKSPSTPTTCTLFALALPSLRTAEPCMSSTPAASSPGKNIRATTTGRFALSAGHGTNRSPQSSASPILPTRASACALSVPFTESPTISAPTSTSEASAQPSTTPRCVRQLWRMLCVRRRWAFTGRCARKVRRGKR